MPAFLTRDRVKSALKKCVACYRACALILFNTFVLFVLLNVVLHYFFKAKDRRDAATWNPVFGKYSETLVLSVYPELSRQEVEQLLHESWNLPFVYEPYTLFKERPALGKWANLDRNGYRHVKNQGPWPPGPEQINVFVFGGSTTFGYGVPDWETIPSHLQELLQEHSTRPVRVYNFGRGHYYSTQERVLLERLVGAGHVPHLAIFLDGINDFDGFPGDDRPFFFHDLLENAFQNPATAPGLLERLPVTRAIHSVKNRLSPRLSDGPPTEEQPPGDTDSLRQYLEFAWPRMFGRYRENIRMIEGICREYDITPLFVVQPSPTYKYDLNHHVFGEQNPPFAHDPRIFTYPWLAKERAAQPTAFGKRSLWLADLQEGMKENLYVDAWHYTGKFCRTVAAEIKDYVVKHQLLGAPPP